MDAAIDDDHSLFVIAKAGQYYRSLAAVRHQCLWGIATLRQCLHILHIFSHSENRIALQQELSFAQDYFRHIPPPGSDSRERRRYDKFGPCPFPFITTCLRMGAALHPETFDTATVDEEPFGLPFDMGASLHGITVFDITDLENVKYCFVHLASIHPESVQPCPSFQPLTGWEYALPYSGGGGMSTWDYTDLAGSLEKKSLVDIHALAETWPWGTWSGERQALPAASPPSSRRLPRSLLEISVEKVVDAAIKDTLEALPNVRPLLKEPLLRRAKDVGTTRPSLLLIALAYCDAHTLDWTPFIRLRAPAIRYIVENGSFSSAKIMNLSGLLTPRCISGLSPVLSHLPALETLCMLDKPGRPDDVLASKAFVQLLSLNPDLRIKKICVSGLLSIPIRGPQVPGISDCRNVIQGLPCLHFGRLIQFGPCIH
ncbi:unnamed protein product [Clonostachys rosea]|uniref:Uncharacterized protein n=1 Tax=Bionectria ochroleuca TaxID=29856 RepID=A0ABY6U766_BIOOC|nr:unnamed protein product [Clonostachys rosea]